MRNGIMERNTTEEPRVTSNRCKAAFKILDFQQKITQNASVRHLVALWIKLLCVLTFDLWLKSNIIEKIF